MPALDGDEGISAAQDRAGDPEPENAAEVSVEASGTQGHGLCCVFGSTART